MMKKTAIEDHKFAPTDTDIFTNEDASSDGGRLVSIIIPAYNEEKNIPRLEKELNRSLTGLPYRFEFLLIDNCSNDNTGELIKEICARDKRWRYIRFSRNFKVESSIAAGYRFAKGDAMVVLYSDLQEPPSVVPSFLEKWEEGYDIVYGVHTARIGEASWLSALVGLAYRLVTWCSDEYIPTSSGDFRLISKRVRDAFEECGEYYRYTRGLIAWLGFPQTGVPYERQPRLAGKSKTDFAVYWAYFSNAITGFSLKPLRAFTLLGLLFFCVSLVVAGGALFVWSQGRHGLTINLGFVSLQFFIGGFQLLAIGILGEYAGRTYMEVKRRPLYLIEQAVNLEIPKSQSVNKQIEVS